jgi:Domain of unknown function (DUF5134)
MSSAPILQWTLTGIFAVCAVLYAAQVRAAGAWQPRVAWSLHSLMAVAMIAMAWPWGTNVSPLCYVLIFTAAALYFAYLGLFGERVGHTVYHGVMMASMVLMALAMSPSSMPNTANVGAMGSMPGMDMAGGTDQGAGPPSTPAWVTLTCILAAALFIGAALWSFFVVVRGPQRPYANLLMTTGMGVAFAALAI